MKTLVLVVLTTSLLARRATAGVADSPLPELLTGATTQYLYTVPGVLRSGGVETLFSCTSLEESATMQVGVELFFGSGGAPANDAVATSLSVGPGATVVFGTSAVAWIGVSSSLGGASSRGSARILATSKKLACTAFLTDCCSAPPTSMTYLTIISKLKQKAAN